MFCVVFPVVTLFFHNINNNKKCYLKIKTHLKTTQNENTNANQFYYFGKNKTANYFLGGSDQETIKKAKRILKKKLRRLDNENIKR